MSVTLISAERLNALKQGIEAKTGETYTDLTDGVNALIAGFGAGGGTVVQVEMMDVTVLEDFVGEYEATFASVNEKYFLPYFTDGVTSVYAFAENNNPPNTGWAFQHGLAVKIDPKIESDYVKAGVYFGAARGTSMSRISNISTNPSPSTSASVAAGTILHYTIVKEVTSV